MTKSQRRSVESGWHTVSLKNPVRDDADALTILPFFSIFPSCAGAKVGKSGCQLKYCSLSGSRTLRPWKNPLTCVQKTRLFSCHELITVYGWFRRLDAITVTQIHSFSQHNWGLHSLIYSWVHSCCSAWMNKVLQWSPPQGSGIWTRSPPHGPFSHTGSFNTGVSKSNRRRAK